MILLVTGTGTGVGKTVGTAALALRARQAGWRPKIVKPVQTGEPEGAGDIRDIEGLTGIAGQTFVRYPDPLAPNLAARRAGMPTLALSEVAARLSALDESDTLVLVEGAGGLLVRLGEDWNLADLAVSLKAPLVLVTATGLGSLNSAELTVEAARRRGVPVAGLIGGSVPDEPDLATRLNLDELPRVCSVPWLGSLPAGAGQMDRAAFAAVAARISLPWSPPSSETGWA